MKHAHSRSILDDEQTINKLQPYHLFKIASYLNAPSATNFFPNYTSALQSEMEKV